MARPTDKERKVPLRIEYQRRKWYHYHPESPISDAEFVNVRARSSARAFCELRQPLNNPS